jgi:hypothetical protein
LVHVRVVDDPEAMRSWYCWHAFAADAFWAPPRAQRATQLPPKADPLAPINVGRWSSGGGGGGAAGAVSDDRFSLLEIVTFVFILLIFVFAQSL